MKLSLRFDWLRWTVGMEWNTGRSHLHLCFLPVRLILKFRRRVPCHKCARPAVMICVQADGWHPMRDPLCDRCGKIGPCPTSVRCHDAQPDQHVPIPNRWYYEDVA